MRRPAAKTARDLLLLCSGRLQPAGGLKPAATHALLLAVLMACASAAAGEQFGPVDVTTLPSLGGGVGGYAQQRVEIVNHDADAHAVVLTIASWTYAQSQQRVFRRVLVPPRGTLDVEIVHLVPQYEASRRLTVRVDDHDYGLQPITLAGSGGRWQPTVLVSRSFPDAPLRTILTSDPSAPTRADPVHFLRCDFAPSQWSTSWVTYAPFRSILVTAEEWTEMPAAARLAVLRRVRSGGTMLLIGDGKALPEAAFNWRQRWLDVAEYGFGTIFQAASMPAQPDVEPLTTAWNRDGNELPNAGSPHETLPLVKERVPASALLVTLFAFAVVAGPANLIVLARRNRRLWIFWTLPALAVGVTVLILAVSLFSEGWQRMVRSASITLLDENAGEATTFGLAGFYATIPPGDGLLFSSDTEVNPQENVLAGDIDLTEGQRFLSGWLKSRVSTYFTFRKCEQRRERLPLRVNGAQLLAMNGFGAPIEKLWLATDDGRVFEATHIEPGQQVALARTALRVTATALPPELISVANAWPSYPQRLRVDPHLLLLRGKYIAVFAQSPFPDRGLLRPRVSAADAVVIGIPRRGNRAR